MNKQLKRLLPFIVLTILVWLLWPVKEVVVKTKTANVVSLKASQELSKQNEKVTTEQAEHQVEAVSEDLVKKTEPKPVGDSELSYLDIYRKYQWALICRPYMSALQRHQINNKTMVFDYSTEYLAQINAQKRRLGQAESASDGQLQSLDVYIAECDAGMAFTELFVEDNILKTDSVAKIDAVGLLWEVLIESKAETQKEQKIKAMIFSQDAINTKQAQIIEMHQGSDTWTESEILQQEQRIQDLMQEIAVNQQAGNEASTVNSDSKRLLKLLMQQLSRQKVKDKEAIKHAITDLIALYSQAKSSLNSGDFDVFYLAKTTTEMQPDFSGMGVLWYDFFRKDYGVNYTTSGEEMMALLEMNEKHVFNQAALPAGMLYLCSLGEDCGENSLLMTSYCLGFNGLKRAVEACGKDLMSFYSGGYLSLGLMNDVQLILELMETEYGS